MKFYVTASIPYVNASPHLGHAMEFVEGDVIARYRKLLGDDVIYLSGADENALKNVQAAEKVGKPVQEFVDVNAKRFQDLAQELNVQFDIFQKGSDTKNHFTSSQKLWKLCEKNGDIYKKEYEGLYCIGCEAFYTEDELDANGECFEHPGKKLEKISETNYFFKLSKYHEKLKELIKTDTLKITPLKYKTELLAFLEKPLLDISISRSNERAKNWGVPVPNDNTQRIYVWFDALNIYQSGVGFGSDDSKYKKWWPADVHIIGKGIVRFHALYWPAFLLSAGLSLPKSLFVHGYITIDGKKMSKSLGNVIDPFTVIKKYGKDAIRYYLLREIPAYDDGNFSEDRMLELYNSDLANELGNLVSRITTLASQDEILVNGVPPKEIPTEYSSHLETYQFHLALEYIWFLIKGLNKKIDEFAPWKKQKNERKNFLTELLSEIQFVAYLLTPLLPDTAEKIEKVTGGTIQKIPPLFPRI